MNKFITKVAKLVLGLSLAAGVGVAIGSQSKASRVEAADTTYTFSSASWAASPADWTSGKAGNGFTSGQGIQVTTGTTGANATSPKSFSNVTKIVVVYNTNKSAGAGSIEIQIGSNTAKSNNVAYSSGDGRSANYTTEFNYGTAESGSVKITVNTTTNSIWPKSITITESDACDHTYGDWVVTTAATCTTAGSHKKTCSKCGNEVVETIEPLGHDYGEWSITTQPTCTTAGEKTRVCSRDNTHVETEAIPATGHSFVNGVCSVCGAEQPNEYSIVFGTEDGTAGLTGFTNTSYVIPSGVTLDNIQGSVYGKNDNTSSAIRFGKSGATGSFDATISNEYVITSVKCSLKYYGSDSTATFAVTPHGGSAISKSLTGTFADYVYDVSAANTNKVTLGTDVNGKRAYLSAFTLEYEEASTPPEPILYTVTYDANLSEYTGAVPASTTQSTEGGSITVASALSCEGYTFVGWNTLANGSGSDVTPGATDYVPQSNHTLYGKWSENPDTNHGTLVITRSSFESGALLYNETDEWSEDASTGETITGEGDLYSSANQETMQTKNSGVSTGYYNITEMPGPITKIAVSVASGTDRTYNVYGSTSASLSSISGLTSVGTVNGSTPFTSNAGYYYFYLECTVGASFLNSITITYEIDAFTKVQLAASNIVMNYGDADATPEVTNSSTSAAVSGCSFSSDNEDVATVVNGKIHAVGKGTATITVSHEKDLVNEITYKNTTFTVTVHKLSAIQDIYSLANSTPVEINGYYAGEYADGIVLMDGSYGILVYHASSQSDWVIDQTIVHVDGKVKIYSGLYEIDSDATVSKLTGSDATDAALALSLPSNQDIVEITPSTAPANVANRRTYVEGVLKSCTASSSNYNITVTVSGVDVALYLKSDDNVNITVSGETMSISAYLSNQIDKNVTIKGFTSFFSSNFQVRVYDVIIASATYTVEAFAQDVLDDTDAVCSSAEEPYNYKSALTLIWNGLEDKWRTLSVDEQNKWNDTTTYTPNYNNNSTEVVENALGRYNFLCKKYEFSNFTERSDVNGAPVTPAGSNLLLNAFTNKNTNTVAIIVIISLVSVTAIGGYFFIRKRREN